MWVAKTAPYWIMTVKRAPNKRKLLSCFYSFFLIRPFNSSDYFADWGDVYYCQMTTLSETTLEGKRTDYILEKFQFKLDKTKNAMVFGKSGIFKGCLYI